MPQKTEGHEGKSPALYEQNLIKSICASIKVEKFVQQKPNGNDQN